MNAKIILLRSNPRPQLPPVQGQVVLPFPNTGSPLLDAVVAVGRYFTRAWVARRF